MHYRQAGESNEKLIIDQQIFGDVLMTNRAVQPIELQSAEQIAGSPALTATDDFIASRALEILREWITDPEIRDLLQEAELVKAADAARKNAA